MSGIINAKPFGHAFPLVLSSGPNDTYAAEMQGTVTAVYEVGCFFGAIFVRRLSRPPCCSRPVRPARGF